MTTAGKRPIAVKLAALLLVLSGLAVALIGECYLAFVLIVGSALGGYSPQSVLGRYGPVVLIVFALPVIIGSGLYVSGVGAWKRSRAARIGAPLLCVSAGILFKEYTPMIFVTIGLALVVAYLLYGDSDARRFFGRSSRESPS
jgi:hypothetical protein